MPADAAHAAAPAEHTKWPNYREGDFVIRNYEFRSGEALPELKLHYRTLGTAKRNAAGKITNGVLLLQGNTGTGANWLRPSLADELFRARAAARCGRVFHDHAGRDRARRVEQAVGRAPGQVSALPLPRHGRERLSADHRGSRGRPSAPRDRQLDGRHARLDVGRNVPRPDGRGGAALMPADRDQRAQLDQPPRRRRGDPPRSRVEQRELRRPTRARTS